MDGRRAFNGRERTKTFHSDKGGERRVVFSLSLYINISIILCAYAQTLVGEEGFKEEAHK